MSDVEALQECPPKMAKYDSVCDDHHRMVLRYFIQQVYKMRIDERIGSLPHRVLALDVLKTRIVPVDVLMCLLPRLVTIPRSLEELLHLVEPKVLLSDRPDLDRLGRGILLRKTNSFGSPERTLQIRREDMGDPDLVRSKVRPEPLGLEDSMIRQGRICDASAEFLAGSSNERIEMPCLLDTSNIVNGFAMSN